MSTILWLLYSYSTSEHPVKTGGFCWS